MYEYHWLPGTLVSSEQLASFAQLYSEHYGVWGDSGPNPGKPIRLTGDRLRRWLVPESLVVWATALGELVGYAIAVQSKLPRQGPISWVSQLVVHEAHRQHDVGKTLLFTIWRFTNHFAWGLLTANPYAIRALEKATRRRCQPRRILINADALTRLGPKVIPYLRDNTETVISPAESRANTEFFLDHSELSAMLATAVTAEKPWALGPLPEGWEWFAFTFQDQDQINLTRREIEEMLAASDRLTRYAYSRMALDTPTQTWATHHVAEVEFIVQNCGLRPGDSVLDFGCGQGRHTIDLAARGFRATGIDYVSSFIDIARAAAHSIPDATFELADCRTVELGRMFDTGLCLYDVIGSYADERDNLALLRNLTRHTKPGGFVLISVMNMEITERNAKHWFSLAAEPDRLLALQPSSTMETTGNIFNPEFYLIDRETKIVYRKEQFTKGYGLPEEILVRDRRYTEDQIRHLCVDAGLDVLWCRFVRSGRWEEPLTAYSAKEILVLCRKPALPSSQGELFL
jgi:2-polyprenyl-3-methyl-5-hydroxy-6-metoxy-1,4-benzoquinol methylase